MAAAIDTPSVGSVLLCISATGTYAGAGIGLHGGRGGDSASFPAGPTTEGGFQLLQLSATI